VPNILGQPLGVETHAGKFGINALQDLVRKSDGHTLMVGNVITNSMTPLLSLVFLDRRGGETPALVGKVVTGPVDQGAHGANLSRRQHA
jgi:hypothetical protein